jgi:hypothetical protein
MNKKASSSDRRGARGVRFKLLAIATFLALVAATLSALSLSVPPASADVVPNLTVTVNPDGSLHAAWNMSGQVAEEFLYDTPQATDGHLAETTSLVDCGNGEVACCPHDSWCWASQGVPLYCYWVLYQDQTGDCAGHSDLADAATTYDTYPLQLGETYFVQVLVADSCFSDDTSCHGAQPLYWSNVVHIVDNPPPAPSTTTTSTTTTSTLPSSGGPVPAKLADFPTMPDNGAVNCEADNYLIENYDLAADSRNKQAESLRTAEKDRTAAAKELATATGQQADNLRVRLQALNLAIQQLKSVIAKLDAGLDQINAAVRAQKQACQKTTKADPDPGRVGPFVDPPIPDNDTAPCNKLRPRAEYLRTSLAKLFGNKDFDARFNVKNEVRKQQIETQIARLEHEFGPKYRPALNACSSY